MSVHGNFGVCRPEFYFHRQIPASWHGRDVLHWLNCSAENTFTKRLWFDVPLSVNTDHVRGADDYFNPALTSPSQMMSDLGGRCRAKYFEYVNLTTSGLDFAVPLLVNLSLSSRCCGSNYTFALRRPMILGPGLVYALGGKLLTSLSVAIGENNHTHLTETETAARQLSFAASANL